MARDKRGGAVLRRKARAAEWAVLGQVLEMEKAARALARLARRGIRGGK